jgi:hypothetical protein
MRSKDKLIIKYNGSRGAILCSDCSKILKVGWQFTDEETKFFTSKLDYLPPQYCEHCKNKRNGNNN